jgi:hypothetical protein
MRTSGLVFVLLAVAVVASAAQARQPGSGAYSPGNSYVCEDTGNPDAKKCRCSGIADCKDMRTDGVCKPNTTSCNGTRCKCDWNIKLKRSPLRKGRPVLRQ